MNIQRRIKDMELREVGFVPFWVLERNKVDFCAPVSRTSGAGLIRVVRTALDKLIKI